MEEATLEDFFKKFDTYNGSEGNIIIHPGLPYNFIELDENFVQELKEDLKMKVKLSMAGIDELDPTTKFAIMILTDSY